MANASSLLFSALFTYQIFYLNYSERHVFPIHFAFFPPFFFSFTFRHPGLMPNTVRLSQTSMQCNSSSFSVPISFMSCHPFKANSKQKSNTLWERSRTKFPCTSQIPGLRKEKSKQNEMRCTISTAHSHLILT